MQGSGFFNFDDLNKGPLKQPDPPQMRPKPTPAPSSVPPQKPKEYFNFTKEDRKILKEKKYPMAKQIMSIFMKPEKFTKEEIAKINRAKKDVQQIVDESVPKNPAELRTKKDYVQNKQCFQSFRIMHELQKIEDIPPCKVQFYGSAENGFWIGNSSDIDISIVPIDPNFKLTYLLIERILRNLYHRFKGKVKSQYIPSSNLPVLKCKMPFQFDKVQSQLEFDINAGAVLGHHNSILLATYVKLDARFHHAGLYLKNWSKKCIRGRHDGLDNTNTLSSYALTLMLLVLMQSKHYLLPRLQAPGKENIVQILDQRKKQRESQIQKYFEANLFFISDLSEAEEASYKNEEQDISTVQLLIEFFYFYVYVFDHQNMVIDVPRARFSKKQNVKVPEGFPLDVPFTIIDPFDVFHNPGKAVFMNSLGFKTTLEAMVQQMRRLMGD